MMMIFEVGTKGIVHHIVSSDEDDTTEVVMHKLITFCNEGQL